MYEWRARVRCPVRPVEDDRSGTTESAGFVERRLYVWTQQRSAVDAYDEALRVLRGWPSGSRPVDIRPMGMYLPSWDADR